MISVLSAVLWAKFLLHKGDWLMRLQRQVHNISYNYPISGNLYLSSTKEYNRSTYSNYVGNWANVDNTALWVKFLSLRRMKMRWQREEWYVSHAHVYSMCGIIFSAKTLIYQEYHYSVAAHISKLNSWQFQYCCFTQ